LIRLAVPSIEEDDLAAVREALASGQLVQGPRVLAFEQAIADYIGTEYAVAVSNCTAALLLGLISLDVGPGDKVAVTAFSWPATANVIVLCGAEPIFIDIEPETYNMDPLALEQALASKTVKAVLPVHTFGGMADMGRILEIAKRQGAAVIEDAACAFGAELDGKRAGTFGALGCFSFHPRKAVTTGEGGVITTDDPALARRLRILRNHGQDPDAFTPDFVSPGYNMRLTEFQAALGLTQINKVDRITEKRRLQAAHYDELIGGGRIRPPRKLYNSRHVYQSYVALLPSEAAAKRTSMITALRERGIETTIGTYHIPMTTYFRGRGAFRSGDFPVTDDVSGRAISLPMFENLTMEDQQTVVSTLEELLEAEAMNL
jgi:perosamine synthetase